VGLPFSDDQQYYLNQIVMLDSHGSCSFRHQNRHALDVKFFTPRPNYSWANLARQDKFFQKPSINLQYLSQNELIN
jgi:hypothetical protein